MSLSHHNISLLIILEVSGNPTEGVMMAILQFMIQTNGKLEKVAQTFLFLYRNIMVFYDTISPFLSK